MKRFLAGFLTLVLLLTGITLAASAVSEEDFDAHLKYEGDKIYYIEDDGSVFKGGWKEIHLSGVETFEDEDGTQYSEPYDRDSWIYAKADGALAQDEWVEVSGKWYYFFWIWMGTGNIEVKDTYYLLDQSGAWTGASAKTPGWVKNGSDWYYLARDTEYDWTGFVTDQSYKVDGVPYFFDKNGKMGSNGWQKETWDYDGTTYTNWYYAQPNGALVTGWKKIDGVWYYFNEYGRMYHDRMNVKIGDNRYAFRGSGAMVEDSWYSETWTSDDGTTYTDWVYANKDGSLATGWKKINGTWYYFDKYGWMATGWLNTDDEGKIWYYLDKSGAMVSGWQKIGDYWYYFDESGVQVMNSWIKDGDSWYYVVDDMLKDGTFTIDGKEYTFDASGAWIK